MTLKGVWNFIKGVIWPVAKPFLCASREEAEELVIYARNAERVADRHEAHGHKLDRDLLPRFVLRCIEALEEKKK